MIRLLFCVTLFGAFINSLEFLYIFWYVLSEVCGIRNSEMDREREREMGGGGSGEKIEYGHILHESQRRSGRLHCKSLVFIRLRCLSIAHNSPHVHLAIGKLLVYTFCVVSRKQTMTIISVLSSLCKQACLYYLDWNPISISIFYSNCLLCVCVFKGKEPIWIHRCSECNYRSKIAYLWVLHFVNYTWDKDVSKKQQKFLVFI